MAQLIGGLTLQLSYSMPFHQKIRRHANKCDAVDNEGLISVAAGIAASSGALVGFGLDSFIEVASGSALLWRMKADRNAAERERAERISLRIVGFCFLALAAYIAADSIHSSLQRHGPERSVIGMAIGIASLFVMPLLARAKRRAGIAIRSAAMISDSTQTRFYAYLSVILVAGLLLNIHMVTIIISEGVKGIRGETRECSTACCHFRPWWPRR